MTLIPGKLGVSKLITHTQSLGEFDISSDGKIKFTTENAGPTFTIEVKGRIEAQHTFTFITNCVGPEDHLVDILKWDYLQINITVYDTTGHYVNLNASGFNEDGTALTSISTPNGDLALVNDLVFISSDNSVTITGNSSTSTIDFKAPMGAGTVTLDGVQTLTNKTIDASLNTISNLNTNMLAAGILDTDLNVVSVLDDTIPSAKAVKTYIDAQVLTKDAANEIAFTPDGDIAATNVQAAVVEVRDDTDTKLGLKVDKTTTVNGHALSGNVTVTKTDVNLGNVPDVDATVAANITQDATHRFTNDTDITRLAGTSGTNTGDQTNITGNAATATKLETARTIAGTSFDGSTNINIDHVNLQNKGTNTHAQIDTDLTRLANTSGTNTGDQTITLTGGVTGSGTGSFAATVVTNANLTGDVTSVGNTTTYNGIVPLSKGGTGQTSEPAIRNALGTQRAFDGLEDSTLFVTSYVPATRTLTVTYTLGAAVWVGGVRYLKGIVGGETEVVQHTNVYGKHFYMYNPSGALIVSTTVWNLLDPAGVAPLELVYYDATNVKAFNVSEKHHGGFAGMDAATHNYLHNTRGTQVLSGNVVSASAALPSTTKTVNVTAGSVADEDNVVTTAAVVAGTTSIRKFFRDPGAVNWTWTDDVNTYLTSGADLAYDNAGTLTAVGANNRYMNMYAVVIPTVSGQPQFGLITGQAFYTTLALAQAENPLTALQGVSTLSTELVFIAQLTFRRITNATSSTLESVTALRLNQVTLSGSFNPTDHQVLSNRGAIGAHPASAISIDAAAFDSGLITTATTDAQSAFTAIATLPPIVAGDIRLTSFSAANNQVTPASVTGLAFSTATVRGFDVLVTVAINATTGLSETFRLLGAQISSGFVMTQESVGDDSGIVFTITSTGQIEYTSTNVAGFVSNKMDFRAVVTNI